MEGFHLFCKMPSENFTTELRNSVGAFWEGCGTVKFENFLFWLTIYGDQCF